MKDVISEWVELPGDRGRILRTDMEKNSASIRRQIFWEGFPISVTKPDEMVLTDDQLREKWKKERADAQRNSAKDRERRGVLFARGFSKNEIDHLRPFEEWDKEKLTPALIAYIWAEYFEKTKRHPLSASDITTLRERAARVRKLRKDEGEKYGAQNVRVLVTGSKTAHAEATLRGDPNPPKILGEQEAFDLLMESRRIVNQEIARLTVECRPIIDRAIEELKTAATLVADHLQGVELEAHAKTDRKFNWEYVPSRTVICLRQLPWRAKELLENGFPTLLENFAIK